MKIEYNPDILEQTDEVDYSKIAKDCFIDVDETIDMQPIALSLGKHEHKGQMYDTPIASYGDFFCLIGASKSRKTYAKKGIISSYIGGNASSYFPDLKGHGNKYKVIIDNDTEQSKFHAQRGARQILNMVGSKYPYYKPYEMRSLNYKDRIGLIKWQLENIDNIGLMFIDGIADLVRNVNDLDECNDLVQMLMSWSKDYNIAIGTILHINYGGIKATGHLGSAVTKKAETVVLVETTEGVTSLKANLTRNISFNDIEFEVGTDGLPKQSNLITSDKNY